MSITTRSCCPRARALLTSDPRGRCTYIDADAREVDKILAEAAGTLDFSQPVAVMMLGLLHFIPDADDPYQLIRRYLDAVPSGSYLAISHASSDLKTDTGTAGQRYNSHSATAITFRSRQEVTRLVAGLDLVPSRCLPASPEPGSPCIHPGHRNHEETPAGHTRVIRAAPAKAFTWVQRVDFAEGWSSDGERLR